jgi:hypothetical protein
MLHKILHKSWAPGQKAFLTLLCYETQKKHATRANPNHLDTTAMYRLRKQFLLDQISAPKKKITGRKCDWVFAQRRMSGWAEFDVRSLRKWRWRQNRNQKCGSRRRRTKTTKTELTELRSYGGGFSVSLCSHWVSLFSIHTVFLPTWKNWPLDRPLGQVWEGLHEVHGQVRFAKHGFGNHWPQ